jgi:hypothetical protein
MPPRDLLRSHRRGPAPGPSHPSPEELRALLRTGSLQDASATKTRLGELVDHAAQPETTRLWRTACRWWKEIEVLKVTGATTAKVEATNTAIKLLKRTGRGFVNSPELHDAHYAQKRRQNSGLNIHRTVEITTNRGEPPNRDYVNLG